MTDALVPAGDVGSMLARPADLNAQLAAWRERYHVLSPSTHILGTFASGVVLTASIVLLNALVDDDGRGIDTYMDPGFMRKGPNGVNDPKAQRAINKIGLMRIASCAGIVWTERCGRRDDRRVPFVWEYFAEGDMLTPDGQWQTLSGTVEIDLRDGSPQIGGWTLEKWEALLKENRGKPKDEQKWSVNGWSDKRVLQARRFGLSLAESKSKLRAIRSIGVQSVYTVEELRKPFVVLRAVYQPGADNLEGRRLVAERALFGRRTLYAIAETRRALPERFNDAIDDPTVSPALVMDATSSPLPPPASPVATPPPAPVGPASPPEPAASAAPTQSPAPPALRIAQVERKTITRRSDKREFLKFFVTDSLGEIHSTMSRPIGELAEKLQASGDPVEISTSTNEYGSQIEELQRAQPRLPMDEGSY
jgi:hypothetical protein